MMRREWSPTGAVALKPETGRSFLTSSRTWRRCLPRSSGLVIRSVIVEGVVHACFVLILYLCWYLIAPYHIQYRVTQRHSMVLSLNSRCLYTVRAQRCAHLTVLAVEMLLHPYDHTYPTNANTWGCLLITDNGVQRDTPSISNHE